MEEGDKLIIEVGNQSTPVVFIGGGGTTLAFSEEGLPSIVYLFVADLRFNDGSEDEDFSKDVLAEAYSKAPNNPYLPEIAFIKRAFVNGQELNKSCKIYRMPFYRDIEESDVKAWLEMKSLHKIRSDGKIESKKKYHQETGEKPSLVFLGNEAVKKSVEFAQHRLVNNPELVEALEVLGESLVNKNRKGLTFEFNKRNMSVGEEGHLVLRDCVYDAEITVKILRDRQENGEKNDSR